MTLNLTPDIEAYLREKAAREGQTAEVVAQTLLTQAIENDARSQSGVLLKEYRIDPIQATELRARLVSFAEEWEQPGMDVYDDYDAAKACLEASQTRSEAKA